MLVGQRQLDVDGGEEHEDVGLQQRDEDLEEAERDAELPNFVLVLRNSTLLAVGQYN